MVSGEEDAEDEHALGMGGDRVEANLRVRWKSRQAWLRPWLRFGATKFMRSLSGQPS